MGSGASTVSKSSQENGTYDSRSDTEGRRSEDNRESGETSGLSDQSDSRNGASGYPNNASNSNGNSNNSSPSKLTSTPPDLKVEYFVTAKANTDYPDLMAVLAGCNNGQGGKIILRIAKVSYFIFQFVNTCLVYTTFDF
jgi:hypothetical protein